MKIDTIGANLLADNLKVNHNTTPNGNTGGFISYLKDALGEVDTLQKDASLSAAKLVFGEEEHLHNTMLAYEKANIALQLTIEVRNKIVEAYQEIMRIQM